MDENVQVVRWKLPEPDCVSSSLYVDGVHFIFIDLNATPEEQEEAERRERARKAPK